MHVAKEIIQELASLVTGYLLKHRYLRLACVGLLALIVMRVGVAVPSLLGAGDKHGFSYPQVDGRVLYEDGDKIPLQGLSLQFLASADGGEAARAESIGSAVVDQKSGAFSCMLRLLPSQTKQVLKVTLALNSGAPPPSDLIPTIYADPKTTPLDLHPRGGTVAFRIKKPRPYDSLSHQ